MKNIEILYTCDVCMSEEPIFSYTFLEYVQGHPTKNDCSTDVLLDFCTRATFLRSVPVLIIESYQRTKMTRVAPFLRHWEAPEIKKCRKIDQKFPFWSCQSRLVTSQELPICTTCTCVVQNGKSWLFRTEI
jgi:hypothetical protein